MSSMLSDRLNGVVSYSSYSLLETPIFWIAIQHPVRYIKSPFFIFVKTNSHMPLFTSYLVTILNTRRNFFNLCHSSCCSFIHLFLIIWRVCICAKYEMMNDLLLALSFRPIHCDCTLFYLVLCFWTLWLKSPFKFLSLLTVVKPFPWPACE